MTFINDISGSVELAIFAKLLLAALAGAAIGFEREMHGRPAGLRTHLLVAVASCLMMILSEGFTVKYGAVSANGPLRIDPSRVAAQIVAGIGFIGAGVILKEGLSVRGLTTAACLWLAAGLGMGYGMGAFFPTSIAVLIGLLGLVLLKKLEPYIKKDRYLSISVTCSTDSDLYQTLEGIFDAHKMRLTNVACDHDLVRREIRYDFTLTQHRRRMGRELSTAIAALAGVRKIRYK